MNNKKKVLVLGARGSVGRQTVAWLAKAGHKVIAAARFNREGEPQVGEELLQLGAELVVPLAEVSDPMEMSELAAYVSEAGGVDAVVYAVGHCPAGGFKPAVSRPLSKFPLEELERECAMHILGPKVALDAFLDCMTRGGCFIFISSAITRMRGKLPVGAHAEYHGASISAMNWLIDGMRKDPEVREWGVKIHRLAPGALDTPFHDKNGPGPALLPVGFLVDAIRACLEATDNVDEQDTLVAAPRQQ